MSNAAELLQTGDLVFLALGVLASAACAITAACAILIALARREPASSSGKPENADSSAKAEHAVAIARLVPAAMAVELVLLLVAPLLVWLAANDSSTRFGADSVVVLFVAPSLRAIGPLALALTLANGLVIALLRASR